MGGNVCILLSICVCLLLLIYYKYYCIFVCIVKSTHYCSSVCANGYLLLLHRIMASETVIPFLGIYPRALSRLERYLYIHVYC